MTHSKSPLEIMSPVGSFEAIDAAIRAGAGSVYFGAGRMNMRAAMKVSFSPDDLPEIVERCRKHGVKSYLTLNIVLYDEELEEAKRLVDKAKESGISAVIACDHAILVYCRKIGMPVHISTQANITNIEEVDYFSQFAGTMVLGRELSLEQIANIVREIEARQIRGPSGELVRIEIFVHGYFCMAISGKCYISLDTYGTSANRGECQVNCKRPYILKDAKDGTELEIDNEYILSAKDLCTIDFIDKIVETGASVLKIEGRKKGVDYVYTTTRCYREAVDAYLEGAYTPERINQWKLDLAGVFNRGFWSGYYLGRKVEEEEWSGDPASRIIQEKTCIAEAKGYNRPEGRAEFGPLSQKVRDGDNLLIIDPDAGIIDMRATGISVGGRQTASAKEGETLSLPVPKEVTGAARLYKIQYKRENPTLNFALKTLNRMIGDRAYQSLRQKALEVIRR